MLASFYYSLKDFIECVDSNPYLGIHSIPEDLRWHSHIICHHKESQHHLWLPCSMVMLRNWNESNITSLTSLLETKEPNNVNTSQLYFWILDFWPLETDAMISVLFSCTKWLREQPCHLITTFNPKEQTALITCFTDCVSRKIIASSATNNLKCFLAPVANTGQFKNSLFILTIVA